MKPITRRSALAMLIGTVTASGLSGCGLLGSSKKLSQPVNPLAEHLQATVILARLYEASFAAAPELAARYGAILDNHWMHADTLAVALRQPAPSRSSPPPTPDDKHPVGAVDKAGLLAAEQQASASAYKATLTIPSAYSPLLGSIAACRATHVEVLS